MQGKAITSELTHLVHDVEEVLGIRARHEERRRDADADWPRLL